MKGILDFLRDPVLQGVAVVGATTVALLGLLFPKWRELLRAWLKDHAWLALIMIGSIVAIGLLIVAFSPGPTPTVTKTSTPSLASDVTPTIPPPPIPTPDCPYQRGTDEETLKALIHAEAEAVNNEENYESIIGDIFSPNAHVRDERKNEGWNNPFDSYKDRLEILDFAGATHFEIRVIEIKEDVARATSGSRGTYNSEKYDNPPGSDQWTFRKNSGCWEITEFVFNAMAPSSPTD